MLRRFLIFLAALAAVATSEFAAAAPASEIYRLSVTLTTTCDWTIVRFKEAPMGAFLTRIREGARAPNLWIDRGPSLSIGKYPMDATRVIVDFEVYVDLKNYSGSGLTLVITKGVLNSTSVSLSNANTGSAKLIGNYVADGSVGAGGREFAIPLGKIAEGGPVPTRSFAPMVLAFYYPWFGTPGGATGFWHQWGPSLPRYGAAHTPTAGYYDSQDEATVRRHIREAREAGIDGFVISWWGRNSFEDRAFRKILAVAADECFPVSIYYESASSLGQVIDDFKYIIRQYGASPGFLKSEADPVLFVFGRVILKFTRDEWKLVFQSLSQEQLRCFCQADGLSDAYIEDDGSLDFLFEVFQGVHTYIPVFHDQASLRELTTLDSLRAKGRGVLFAATVVPGYDDTLIRKPGSKRDRQGGALFKQMWDLAVEGKPDWVLVTTFNEWHEGTEIEPSLDFGRQYLTFTRDQGNIWNPIKSLRIVARGGGTTEPAPGTYRYNLGATVSIRAISDPHYALDSWGADGSGTASALSVTLDRNKTIIANFVKTFTLAIEASRGGTTNPAPGSYVYRDGTGVPVAALPDVHFDFGSWTGNVPAGRENDNPLIVTMDADKAIKANYVRRIYAPLNAAGQKILNRSLSQSEYINVLTWAANPDNEDIFAYRVYQLAADDRIPLAEVGGSVFRFQHRGVEKDGEYSYAVVAVNGEGREGHPAVLTFR